LAVKSSEKKGLVVEVRGNNIDKAIRVLNRKVKHEGIIRDVRQRQYYEKPSVKRRRKAAEAVRRIARANRTAPEQ
jgi:small subunit ribosomal protein S21